MLDILVEIAKMKERVVGIDLASGPLHNTSGPCWIILGLLTGPESTASAEAAHTGEGRSPREIRL